MNQNKNQKILYSSTPIIYMVMKCLNFFQEADSNVLEVDLEHPKELRELNNDYLLAPNKIEIKKEVLLDYQLNIGDIYNIPTGNVKKLVRNFFDNEKYVIRYKNLKLYLRHHILEFNQSQPPKKYIELNTQEKIDAEKKW